MIKMSLTILRAEWWREKLFKKNKIIEELPKRSEKFKQIESEIDKAITLQLNGGWEMTEKEQKIQDEFLPKLFKEMIGKKELPEKPQLMPMPRNKTEAVEMLKKINKRFPGLIEKFVGNLTETIGESKKNGRLSPKLKEAEEELEKNGEISDSLKETLEKRVIHNLKPKNAIKALEMLQGFGVIDKYPEIVKKLKKRINKT